MLIHAFNSVIIRFYYRSILSILVGVIIMRTIYNVWVFLCEALHAFNLVRTQQEVPVHRSNTLPSYVQRTTRLATSLDRGDVETLNWIGALVHRNIADYTRYWLSLVKTTHTLYSLTRMTCLPIVQLNQMHTTYGVCTADIIILNVLSTQPLCHYNKDTTTNCYMLEHTGNMINQTL